MCSTFFSAYYQGDAGLDCKVSSEGMHNLIFNISLSRIEEEEPGNEATGFRRVNKAWENGLECYKVSNKLTEDQWRDPETLSRTSFT